MDIIKKIRHLASERRWSLASLEEAAGIPRNRIPKWNDPEDIKLGHLIAVARVLEVSVGELIGESNAPANHEEAIFLAQARKLGLDVAWDRLLLNPRSIHESPTEIVGEVDLGEFQGERKRPHGH